MSRIASGTQLGPYRVESLIGEGGMGQVYRGVDTRLDRAVAIKVLPSHLSHPQLRERFEREARAISSLSHPHICTLFDVGRQDGIDYLVMEHLEGESLADRLARGALPLEQALRYGAQIAEALANAHRHGVVHRDLKPGNVMITRSGAKLLDFGLAKTASAAVLTPDAPTERHKPLTTEGTVLGTFQYMAPEQLEGQEADARTDIFAFGALLYEMVTGRRAFEGKTRTSVMAAIVERNPPPVAEHQPAAPPVLDAIIQTCLAKDRDERWQSAYDVAKQLRQLPSSTPAASPSRSLFRPALLLAGIAGAAIALAAVLLSKAREEDAAQRSYRLQIPVPLPANAADMSAGEHPAVSPDGQYVAMVVRQSEKRTIWIHDLATGKANPLQGTEDGWNPFWSPDSRHVGFFASGELRRIPISGGPPQKLADAGRVNSGSWGADGTIVFSARGLSRVGASGGPVQSLQLKFDDGAVDPVAPHFVGGTGSVLVSAWRPQRNEGGAYLCSLETNRCRFVMAVDSKVIASGGYLLGVREGVLLAQRFHHEKAAVSGDPIPVAQPVRFFIGTSSAEFSASTDGRVLVYRSPRGISELTIVDRRGETKAKLPPAEAYQFGVRLSPGASKAAVAIMDRRYGTFDLWSYDVDRGTKSRLTINPGEEFRPVWSPDEKTVVFGADWEGPPHLYATTPGGSTRTLIPMSGKIQEPWDWSDDGRYIAYTEEDQKNGWDLLLLTLETMRSTPLLTTPFNEAYADFSPDGAWIAYMSNASGEQEVYVMPIGGGEPSRVSVSGGTMPRWSADGNEIFFRGPGNSIYAARVVSRAPFRTDTPVRLFGDETREWFFDVFPDGQRFLVNSRSPDIAPLEAVINWPAMVTSK